MFLAIVISGFVAGAILGLRFRVFVLGPAILFAAIGTVAISFANGLSGGTALAVLTVMVTLQCGYVAGVATAYLEHVPPELNWQDSHGVLDRRFYRY